MLTATEEALFTHLAKLEKEKELLVSENAIQAQRIRHLEYECVRLSKEKDEIGDLRGEIARLKKALRIPEEKDEIGDLRGEIARLKKALRIADEAVNIATGE